VSLVFGVGFGLVLYDYSSTFCGGGVALPPDRNFVNIYSTPTKLIVGPFSPKMTIFQRTKTPPPIIQCQLINSWGNSHLVYSQQAIPVPERYSVILGELW